MRKIKFRGLRTDGKGWVIGVPFFIHSERKCFIIDNCQSGKLTQEDSIFDGKEVLYRSVGQFTGLKDKNGKEIYEDDVLEYRCYHSSEIMTQKVRFGWYYTDNDGRHHEYVMGWVDDRGNPIDTNGNEYKITGNIHEKGG